MKKAISMMVLTAAIVGMAGCGNSGSQNNSGITTGQQNTDVVQEEQNAYGEAAKGDNAPDFTAELADGSTLTLSEQKDKVVLLNFWGTWCGPCVAEMPAFEKLHSEYGEEVVILAVNSMEDKNTVDKFIEDNGYTFPIAYDTEGEISRKYPTDGIPYTLIIGKDGIVKNIYLGAADADTQYQYYKSAIDEALEE